MGGVGAQARAMAKRQAVQTGKVNRRKHPPSLGCDNEVMRPPPSPLQSRDFLASSGACGSSVPVVMGRATYSVLQSRVGSRGSRRCARDVRSVLVTRNAHKS